MTPTSADMCRANGWSVGDILVSDDDFGSDRVRITAIGEDHTLARWLPSGAEVIIFLDFREWRKVESVHI